jgi:hypothetical protein
MIGSSLRDMRQRLTVNVYSKAVAPAYAETAVYTGLIATREQRDAFEQMSDSGAVITVTDVFWFEPVSGVLPSITEGHVMTTGGSRYEVLQVADQGGEGNRLRVMTRRFR